MLKYFSWSKSMHKLTLAISIIIMSSISALADWRKEIGVFRIGIITSERSVEALDYLEPFKLAISEALDMDVEFFRANSSTVLMDALANERIEYAIFSASGYALAWASCECVEPLVTARSKDSTDGFHTILISAPDGPKTLEELVDNEIGVLYKDSITGSALVKHVMAQKSIIIGDEKTPFVSSQSAEETLRKFSTGEIKTLIGWSSMTGNPSEGYSRGSLRQLAELYDVPVSNYQVLWKSDQIPHRPHVIRKKLHGDAKKILRATLLAMNEKDPVAYDSVEPVYGGGFAVSRHERFKQLVDLMKAQVSETKTAEETLPLQ